MGDELPFELNKLSELLIEWGVEFAVLHGSMARGDFNESSDVDLIVGFDKHPGYFGDNSITELEKEVKRVTSYEGDVSEIRDMRNVEIAKALDEGYVAVV